MARNYKTIISKKIEDIILNIKKSLGDDLPQEDLLLLEILEDKLNSYFRVEKEIEKLFKATHFDLDEANKAVKLSNILMNNILSILDRLEFEGDWNND